MSKEQKRYSVRKFCIAPEKHEKIMELLRDGVGIGTIARTVGTGVKTIQIRRQFLLDEQAKLECGDSEYIEIDEPGTIRFRTLWNQVCPDHGKVHIWPCVACVALSRMRKRVS